jgi:valyl-tRNA synthetase
VGWGAREEKEKYCRYDLGRDEFLEKSWVVTEKYRQIFRRMPPVVLNAIGSMLYRHVG